MIPRMEAVPALHPRGESPPLAAARMRRQLTLESAAKLAADQKKAKTYYGKLVTLCRQADSIRPEIEEAKAFLASMNVKDSASSH